MNREKVQKLKENLEAALYLIIVILLLGGAVYVLLTANAADWRELYCQANPINCIRRGW